MARSLEAIIGEVLWSMATEADPLAMEGTVCDDASHETSEATPA